MKSDLFIGEHSQPPDVIGARLIALGMAVSSHRPGARRIGTGEACANILNTLSCLGYRPDGDFTSARVRKDLARWGVRVDSRSSQSNFRPAGAAYEPC